MLFLPRIAPKRLLCHMHVLQGVKLDKLCLYVVSKESKGTVTSPPRQGTQCLVQCKQLGEQRARAVVCGKC